MHTHFVKIPSIACAPVGTKARLRERSAPRTSLHGQTFAHSPPPRSFIKSSTTIQPKWEFSVQFNEKINSALDASSIWCIWEVIANRRRLTHLVTSLSQSLDARVVNLWRVSPFTSTSALEIEGRKEDKSFASPISACRSYAGARRCREESLSSISTTS